MFRCVGRMVEVIAGFPEMGMRVTIFHHIGTETIQVRKQIRDPLMMGSDGTSPQRLKPFFEGVFTDGLKAVPFKAVLKQSFPKARRQNTLQMERWKRCSTTFRSAVEIELRNTVIWCTFIGGFGA